MGKFSEVIFDRSKLPERCIIYAGAYFPRRYAVTGKFFDHRSRIKGHWVKYSFAKKGQNELVLLFNVYGAALTLEVLGLLRDGGVKSVFFIGSIGAKHLKVGSLVVPSGVVDLAGIVLIDTKGEETVVPPRPESDELESALEERGYDYTKAKIASVPAVLHGIRHVNRYLRESKEIEGHEMELSTFYHFAKKGGFRTYACVYVSDNPRHSIISREKDVRLARRNALSRITRVAMDVLT